MVMGEAVKCVGSMTKKVLKNLITRNFHSIKQLSLQKYVYQILVIKILVVKFE